MAHSPQYVNKIERLQNSILRRCLGVTGSTPVHNIYALAHELPPEQRAAFLIAKELLRVKMNDYMLYDIFVGNPRVKSSYSHIYYEFKDIIDKTGHISSSFYSKNISVRLDLLSTSLLKPLLCLDKLVALRFWQVKAQMIMWPPYFIKGLINLP